ncbi:uncharacterized protein LOC116141033 [Pistacia vera]|uniref:uncharacterized protein LOC116141033 n=1 Tax=Pistacia vera TaxID=55513 RepID=UPI001262E025|nr:uncharacterized protein LOC116141033 [Pistacia vera]
MDSRNYAFRESSPNGFYVLSTEELKGFDPFSPFQEAATPIPQPPTVGTRKTDSDQQSEAEVQSAPAAKASSPKLSTSTVKPRLGAILDGLWLILSSTYLLYVSLFLGLSAVVSSFFYFQKVTVFAMTVASSVDRRRLFAQINSFIAVIILAGQLTLTGHILSIAGVTVAICAAPFVAFSNMIAIAIWPTWVVVAASETIRKVVTYVVTRPGRELLFTVVSQEEKYKAKVCIDVIVQRLGDASAAGMYKLLFGTLHGRTSTVSLYALPVSLNQLPRYLYFKSQTCFHSIQ